MKTIMAYQSDDGKSTSLYADGVAAYERDARIMEITKEVMAHIHDSRKPPHSIVSNEDVTVVLLALAQLPTFKFARRLKRIQRQFQRDLMTYLPNIKEDVIPF